MNECKRCLMNDTDQNIKFDGNGFCNYCNKSLDWKTRLIPKNINLGNRLNDVVSIIKEKRKNYKYDCIIGLSGGLDSSYALIKAKELGLRILAVHIDAGWNSELAVKNIEILVKSLNIDLFTQIINWEEMKDLQRSFFFSGVVNCDTPQDHAYFSALMGIAAKESINYVITGQNWQSESISPYSLEWDHMDSKQILDIHNRYGKKPLKEFPILNPYKYLFYYPYIKKIKYIRILDFVNYNLKEATQELSKYNWKAYTGKHNESIFTRFYQNYFLPKKFGYDKRVSHFSSLVVSGEISRNDAKIRLKEPPCNNQIMNNDFEFVMSKLSLSSKEWEKIMHTTIKSHKEYNNFESLVNIKNRFMKYYPSYSYIGPGYKDFMLM